MLVFLSEWWSWFSTPIFFLRTVTCLEQRHVSLKTPTDVTDRDASGISGGKGLGTTLSDRFPLSHCTESISFVTHKCPRFKNSLLLHQCFDTCSFHLMRLHSWSLRDLISCGLLVRSLSHFICQLSYPCNREIVSRRIQLFYYVTDEFCSTSVVVRHYAFQS
jgi:hypothetical protein